MITVETPTATPPHPLEPLTPQEIDVAVTAIRKRKPIPGTVRFVIVWLKEPAREVVLGHQPGDPMPRAVSLILLDNATGKGYEAVVSLPDGDLASWQPLPDG